jgi:predicted Zn-dependent protease
MIGKLASSTAATIAIGLIVLVGMYILYRDMKKLECSIEKLQSRSACAKVLSSPPVNDIEESDDVDEEDDEQEEIIEQAATAEAADTEIEDVVNQLKKEVMSEEQDVAIEDV